MEERRGTANDSFERQAPSAPSDGLPPRMRARMDGLYAQMQTAVSRRALQSALDASPEEFGVAAVRGPVGTLSGDSRATMTRASVRRRSPDARLEGKRPWSTAS